MFRTYSMICVYLFVFIQINTRTPFHLLVYGCRLPPPPRAYLYLQMLSHLFVSVCANLFALRASSFRVDFGPECIWSYKYVCIHFPVSISKHTQFYLVFLCTLVVYAPVSTSCLYSHIHACVPTLVAYGCVAKLAQSATPKRGLDSRQA